MRLKEAIIKSEEEFPKFFANYIKKPYGIIFFNEDNKNSYDSNHAIIYPENIINLKEVVDDIRVFYLDKGIVPRIYHPFVIGYFEKNRSIFESCGYELSIYENYDILTLIAENTLVLDRKLDIHLIDKWDERIAKDIFLPNGEEYEIEVLKKSMENKNNYVFLGYLGEKAVSVLYFHISDYNCTRFDYIVTAKDFRGRGFAREIQYAAVEYCKNNNLPNCFMWYANPISKKICYESGFRSLFELPAGEAVYEL